MELYNAGVLFDVGLKALEERVAFTKAISAIFKTEFDSCSE